jgi:pimeloyl-ACP methyl ester carboxylesterase
MAVTRESWPEFVREANARAHPVFFHEHHPNAARRISAAWAAVPFDVHQHLSKLKHPDLRELVRRLSVPTLVVAGEHDRCTTPDAARWIQENHCDAELVVIPNTAHFMYVEDPRSVAAAVDSFLTARLELVQVHADPARAAPIEPGARTNASA